MCILYIFILAPLPPNKHKTSNTYALTNSLMFILNDIQISGVIPLVYKSSYSTCKYSRTSLYPYKTD